MKESEKSFKIMFELHTLELNFIVTKFHIKLVKSIYFVKYDDNPFGETAVIVNGNIDVDGVLVNGCFKVKTPVEFKKFRA